VDLNKLTTSDKVIAGSAIALFIFSFFPWFGIEGFSAGNGWDFFLWGIIPVLLGLVMLAQVAISAFSPDTKLPDLPVTWGQVHLGAGVLAAVLVVLKLIIGHSESGFGVTVDFDREFGIFLSALAAIGLAVGGFLKFQEEKAGAPSAPPSSF
jgi:hypothetical protein